VLCDGPIDARVAARRGGFGQFGSLQFFGLSRGHGVAQRGPSRPHLVGVDHGLGYVFALCLPPLRYTVGAVLLLGAAWALRLSLPGF
jgi:hypothetical protein